MRKLSEINESLWMDSIKRANTNDVRKEDKSPFNEVFNKCKNNLVDFGLPSGNLWCEMNLGQEETDKPGLFFKQEEITDLNDFLSNKGYKIADHYDFEELVQYTRYQYKKINKRHCYIFSTDKANLIVPNFGYDNKPTKLHRDDALFLHTFSKDDNEPAFLKIWYDNVTDNIHFYEHAQKCSNSFQVRLIKIHK